jgi:hypothetical protein
MGLVRAETVDLYRGGLPINPLPARKGKTFYSPWQKSTVEKKSCVILQGTAAISIKIFAPIIIDVKMI